MEIEILEKDNQSLYAYKDGELLFYATIKFKWFNSLVKIFDHKNDLVLEVGIKAFFKLEYNILFQNEALTKNIGEIYYSDIYFNENKRLTSKTRYFITFNASLYYFSGKNEIAEIKQKIWNLSTRKKFILTIDDEYLEYLNQIIIHILVVQTSDKSD